MASVGCEVAERCAAEIGDEHGEQLVVRAFRAADGEDVRRTSGQHAIARRQLDALLCGEGRGHSTPAISTRGDVLLMPLIIHLHE
jgi:hypothetical protein